MPDYSAIKSFLLSKSLNFYTFFPKSMKPPAEEICEALVDLGFDVRQADDHLPPVSLGRSRKLTPFLITLPRTEKFQGIFKLTGLCHISIR
jgi:hypothetical protein